MNDNLTPAIVRARVHQDLIRAFGQWPDGVNTFMAQHKKAVGAGLHNRADNKTLAPIYAAIDEFMAMDVEARKRDIECAIETIDSGGINSWLANRQEGIAVQMQNRAGADILQAKITIDKYKIRCDYAINASRRLRRNMDSIVALEVAEKIKEFGQEITRLRIELLQARKVSSTLREKSSQIVAKKTAKLIADAKTSLGKVAIQMMDSSRVALTGLADQLAGHRFTPNQPPVVSHGVLVYEHGSSDEVRKYTVPIYFVNSLGQLYVKRYSRKCDPPVTLVDCLVGVAEYCSQILAQEDLVCPDGFKHFGRVIGAVTTSMNRRSSNLYLSLLQGEDKRRVPKNTIWALAVADAIWPIPTVEGNYAHLVVVEQHKRRGGGAFYKQSLIAYTSPSTIPDPATKHPSTIDGA